MVSTSAVHLKKRSLTRFGASWTSKPSPRRYWSSVTWTDTWKIGWYLTDIRQVGGVDGRSDIHPARHGRKKRMRRRQRYGFRSKDALELYLHGAAGVLEPGSPIWLYGANDEGIRSAGKRLTSLFDDVTTIGTRRHCRIWLAYRSKRPAQSPSWRGPT